MTPIAWDTETALIAKGLQAPPLACVSKAWREDGALRTHLSHGRDGRASFRAMADICFSYSRPMVGANIAFDMAVMMAHDPALIPYVFELYDRGLVRDVLIREKLINIAAGEYKFRHGKKTDYSLAGVTLRHTGFELAKEGTWRLRYGELIPVPLGQWPAEAQSYAIDDAAATLICYEAQEPWKALFDDEIARTRTDFSLKLASAYGLLCDPVRVEAFASGVTRRLGEKAARLKAHNLVRGDGTRDTKAAQALVRARVPNPVLTPKEGVSLAEDTIRAIGDPTLNDYADYSSLMKVMSTDVPILKEGLIHSRFEALQETGRTGSSAPNVQNMTRDLDDDTWY